MYIPFAFANQFLGTSIVDMLAQVCKNKCEKIFEKNKEKPEAL